MSVATKNNRSISQLLVAFISCGLFVYFFFHLMHGDRGYFAWKGVEEKLKTSEARYEKTLQERETLEQKVKMLRPDSIDLDLLDERARAVLGFMKPSELVILDKSS
jgi:cell division protein FtsB